MKYIATASSRSGLAVPRIGDPNPCGCAEERRGRRIRDRDCLSRRRVRAGPRLARAPQVARSKAKGRRNQGRLSFPQVSLARQRKVSRRRGDRAAPELGNTLVLDLALGFNTSARTEGEEASTGSARTGVEAEFGHGRFEGQSANFPSLRLALRVLRFTAQRNCDLTLKPTSPRSDCAGPENHRIAAPGHAEPRP